MSTTTKPQPKPTQQIQPLTWNEYYEYESRFLRLVEEKIGKEAATAFERVGRLRSMLSGGEPTEAGMREIAKIRRNLDKFFAKQ